MKKILLLLFLLILNYSYSKDYYWINGSGDWSNPKNWALNSGGQPCNELPSINDNVIFDDFSFTENNSVINFKNVEVKSFTYSSKYVTYFKGSQITIHSNLNIEENVAIETDFILKNNSKEIGIINTGGYVINSNFKIEQGQWLLKNHIITGNQNYIQITNAIFNSNQKSIYTDKLIIKKSSVDLTESSIITLTLLDLEYAKNIGGNPIIYTNGGNTIIKPGDFKNYPTKDQTVNCSGGLVLNLNITADYNGQNISCNGACDGELTIIASGTAGPYGFKFNNTGPFTTQTVFGSLCTGTYSVTVIDSSQQLAPGVYVQCTISEQITEPPVITFGVLGVVQPSCPGVCDGQAFTNAFGGTGTLVITWPNSGEVTANPVALCVGINPVNIVDDNGCTENDQVLITDPLQIDFDVTITPPTCNGDSDAQIFISNETGGNGGPWTYSFNPVPSNGQGSNPATGYSSGNVTISVFDVDGCQQDSIVTITDPPLLTVSSNNPQSVSCFGVCDGSITAIPNGGVPPYTYEWFDNSTGLSTGFTDSIPNSFCSGSYFVVATDAVGCQATSNVSFVGTPSQILANAQVYQISCFGVCDGALDVDPTGGTIPYTYAWTTVPGGSGVGASDSLSGMCAGLYQIIVTDNNGCSSTPDTLEIIEPSQLTLSLNGVDPSCYDTCDGSITATVGGGSPAYTYNWSPNPPSGQGTSSISNICGAIQYQLTVTDNNACTVVDNLTLNNPTTYNVTVNQTDLLCFGDVNGSISVTVNQGGNGGPYSFTWGPGNPTGQGTNSITNLNAGNYFVTISDGINCDTTLTFTILEPSALNVNASVISQVSCNGNCDGSAQVTVSGGSPSYIISWNDPSNQSSNVASNLCAGNYIVTVTDNNGCSSNDNVLITEPAAFNISVSQTDLTCFNQCSGSASVTVNSGGTPPYTILWDDPNNQSSFTAINLCAGTYNATVTDNNLCDTILTFVINEPPELTATVTIDNSSCFGNCTGSATLSINGGTGNYNIEWYNSVTNVPLGINNTTTGNILCPGDYYAIVTDDSNCTVTTPIFTILEDPAIITTIVNETDASCGVCDGQGEVSVSGGSGAYTYLWSPAPGGGQGTSIGTGLCAGVYNVLVTDSSGCSKSQSITINSVALEVLSLDSVDVSCFGACDGQAIASYVCLESPCQIEWFDASTGNSTGIIGDVTPNTLCSGTYIALLTNNLGCVTSDTITVNGPPQILANVVPTDVNCFNACDGSAIATASGGSGSLTYIWNPLPGTGQGTPNAGGLCAGNWTVTVEDSNSCSVTLPFVINQPTDITINSVSATDISCAGANDGSVTVIASNGTPTLTYEWFLCGTNTSIGTGSNLTNLPPGDYYAVVTDGNNCTKTSNCVTVGNQTQLTAVVNSTNPTCYGFCSGEITVTASGGNGNYFYQWLDNSMNPIVGQTNDTLSNVCQGNYYITISDGNGCSITQGPINMTQPTNPWSVTSSVTNIDCNGQCNGTASVTVVSGNNPPYTYQWDDPNNQTTPTATNLCAGTYNVTIYDAGSCDTTIQLTISEASPFNLSGTQNNILCNGDCDGFASVNPSGGVGPYTVIWDNGMSGNTVSNLCAGPIVATITDLNGCTIDTTFIISEPSSPIQTNTVFNNPATCGACNGSATINVIGGTPNYIYTWSGNPTGQGTNSVTGLCAGIISVTVSDANNCSITEVFSITDINGENLDTTHTDASCFGACDGTAEVIYTCSDPGCTQEWFDATTGLSLGITTPIINNLCAGDYLVNVTNNSNCLSSVMVSINEPTQILANDIITAITCNGANDASITVAPSGGSGSGYTFNWMPTPPNGNGTNTALTVGPGIWSVEISDNTGCKDTFDFNIVEPTPINISSSFNDVTCNGACNGNIAINVSGGYGSYTYQWYMNGVAMPGETSSVIMNLCPGNYNVEVTDAGGCAIFMTNDITVSEPFSMSASVSSQDVTCNGQCNGSITVSPSGGNPPYIVNWYDATTNTLIGQTGLIASNLCPGDYYAVISDVNNCMYTTSTVTITENPPLTFTLTTNDASCFGVCDGDATITVNGGQLPYTYIWLDVLNNPLPGASGSSVSNLCAGNYSIEVIDANGCTIGEQNFAIIGYLPITATLFSNNATCGLSDGTATVNPNGGNPGYTYQWLDGVQTPIPGEINQSIINIPAGTYYVDVTDINGCTERFSIMVGNAPSTTITWDNIQQPTCFGGNDGFIECTVTGVSQPLSFVWNPGGMITEDIYGLSSGTYTLEVTDALGCVNYFDTTLVDPSEITMISTITDSDCNLCNGEISLFLNGGTGVLTTIWNNGTTGTLATNLCPAIYEATVTDGAGCSVTEQFTVGNTSGFTASATVTAITCQNNCDGVITINTSGGVSPISYNWLNYPSTNNMESNLCTGTYFIEVTDSIGCNYPLQVDLLNPNPAINATEIINPPTCGNNDGSISVTSTGGNMPHTYLWNTGDMTPGITNLAAGIYTLTVTDNNGCSETFTYDIGNSTAPTVTLNITNILCNAQCTGEISSIVTGGTPAYTYQWLDGSGNVIIGENNPNILNLCSGDYILQVTDNVGCTVYTNATVEEPEAIILNTPVSTPISCNGSCDGSITVNPIGGTPLYTFNWNDPANQTSSTAIDLCAGNYITTITDANGCISSQSSNLSEPAPIQLMLDSIIDATCVNSTDGAIYVTVVGGTPPLQIDWTLIGDKDSVITEDLIDVLPGSYVVSVIDASGCSLLDTFDIDTMLTVLAFAGNDTLICFNNGLVLNGSSNQLNADFTWFDSNNNVISDTSELTLPSSPPGVNTYILMADFASCIFYDTINVTTLNQVLADAGPDLTTTPLLTEVIGGTPTADMGSTIIWSPSTYLSDSTVSNPSVIQPNEDITYVVTVIDTNGCVNSDTIYVEVIPTLVIPDGISPNGDGKNDTWMLLFKDDFPNMEVSVYNRWGELLFYDNTGYKTPWDGKYNGEELPVGTYYYVIDLHNEFYPDPYTGPLTIMR